MRLLCAGKEAQKPMSAWALKLKEEQKAFAEVISLEAS
jgi:hypothetical protein